MIELLFKKTIVVIGWIVVLFSFLYFGTMPLLQKKQSLNLLIWSGIVHEKVLSDFEHKTGVHLNISYFGGNEEMIAKLLSTKGRGYDLVMAPDYTVRLLIHYGILQKIDKEKCSFLDAIHPKFLNLPYDPENEYSVPYDWYLLGLGFNKDFFKKGNRPLASWKTIFDPAHMPNHIGLINDSRELINLAIKYTCGTIRPLRSQDELIKIQNVLKEQRKKVEAYTDFRGDFLLESGNCSVVLIPNSLIWKTLELNPRMGYVVPKEGTLLDIESFVIPVGASHIEQVYELLNYLYEPQVQEQSFREESLLPTRKDADYMYSVPALLPSLQWLHDAAPYDVELFENVLTDAQLNRIWIATKS